MRARSEVPGWVEQEVRERIGPAPERATWPLVSIVIPTFDRRERLARLIAGLAERTDYPAFEVVVADNASTDGTVEWLERASLPFPLAILAHPRNLSFSAACNQGAAEARGDLLLFLNNDVDPIEPTWLRRLVASLDDAGAAMAGAVLVDVERASDAGRTGAVQHGGLAFEAAGGTLRTVLRDLGGDLAEAIGPDHPVAAVAAACVLVRREAFARAGGFSELYRYGHEDVELCLRIAEAGGGIVMSRRAVLLHGPDSTRRRMPREEARSLQRANARLLLERWGPRLRREHALDAAAGTGLWSTAADPAADAGVTYAVRAADPALAGDVERLAQEIRALGRPARTDLDGTGWLLADVVVHLRREGERHALVRGRLNVLVALEGPPPPPLEADRYDLVVGRHATTEALLREIDTAASRLARATRIRPVRRTDGKAGPAPAQAQALLVLGMSRTGTSTATRLLSLLGLHLGGEERLMPPDARVNARGYFEHYEIMRLNTAILRAFGGNWKAPPELAPGWEQDPRLDPLRRQAAEILARDFTGASLWGFKDPRTSLTLPFWRPFLGPAPRFVLCHRNPLDVAASLQARDGIAIEAGLDLWRRTAAAAVAATDGAQRIVVRYDEFFADRDGVMASLAAFAGRPEAASDRSVRDRFDAWLTDDLRHHRHGTAELLGHPAVSPGVCELHLVHELAAAARAHPETWDRPLSVAAGAPSALAERVRALAPWRYAIDLGAGARTSPERPELVNRHLQRRRHVLEPLKAALGGSLDGMRVLDLWCGAGYFSLAAVEAGCARVLGLDGRPAHVEQARLVFEARGVDPGRYEFRHANVLKVAPESLGTFDVVLALGLGHRDDAIPQVLERVATWTRRVAVLDLRLAGPDSPTLTAVAAQAEGHGFGVRILEPAFDDWTGAADYRRGERATLLLTYR